MSSAWLVSCLRRSGLLLPVLPAALSVIAPSFLPAQMGSGALAANSATGASAASTAIPSTVLGQVINATTGAPVPRALVRLNDRAVLTDHDGKFRFDQNTTNSANILVTKPGFSATTEMQEGGNLYLQGGQMGVPLELRLYPEALLTGTVIGPDGTPLPRISVTALRSFWEDTGHRWVPVGQDQTDSHGNFRLPTAAGEYRLETRYTPLDRTTGEAVLPVSVPAESSSGTSQVIKVHAGEELHFELRPIVSPTHTVTTTMESSGVRDFVRISARSSSGGTLVVDPQRNGPGGETKIQLPQGTYTLTARRNSAENPEQAETTVTVPDHDISGVVLQFAPVPSLPVELIVDSSVTSDNNVQPPTLPQLGLVLQSDQADPDRGDSSVRPTARRDGSFVLAAAPGSYRLQSRNSGVWYVKSASYGDADLLQQELVVAPEAAGTPIRLVVSNQTGSLQGTVNLNGSPAACWVYLISTGATAQPVLSLRSTGAGSYTAAHLAPGSYQAIAFERRHSANYRDAASLAPFSGHVRSITVNAGDKPSLNLEAVPAAEVAP
ncbi:MAG TPA: carboxypeptidase-like regulatory domain-containing protein [Acidobacteriaceae bacterium]|nr:carboxypeptidase-like regulatory domain-containing protein [Acidobacteriaceae bacterium]